MIPINQADIPAKVTIGNTAESFLSLLDVTLPVYYTATDINILNTTIEIYAEGDVRYTRNPNHTPTTNTGFVIKEGETRIFHGVNPSQLKFFADSDTVLQVEIGRI